MAKFSLGLDFGTESARALLVNTTTGEEAGTVVFPYPHGVMDTWLDGIPLKHDSALQNPGDYLEFLRTAIPELLAKARVDPADVVGIGVDFTSCTVLPTIADGTPLCLTEPFAREPHAYVKLWKHHAAQAQAERLNTLAKTRGEAFLCNYGGSISAEWFFPKVLEVLEDAPQVFEAAERFIEAGDWVVWQLTGKEVRSACQAGYKATWAEGQGFPSHDFLAALHPGLPAALGKLSTDIRPVAALAGRLSETMARATGLEAGTPVGVAIIDAHSAVPACGVTEPGKLVMILGTSACHMLLDKDKRFIPGVAGVVKDGIVPGFYGYESGQAAVGDIFAWFLKFLGRPSFSELDPKADSLPPGAGGVVALDWWHGSRAPLLDASLTGAIFGFDLHTGPEHIYRALIESTAFGTRRIIESFERGGVAVRELYACGGIAEKNKLLLKIFADVTGRVLLVARSAQACALGAAILGAVAAGKEAGGHANVTEAARAMSGAPAETYYPDEQAHQAYERFFTRYERMAEHFGRSDQLLRELKMARRSAAKVLEAKP